MAVYFIKNTVTGNIKIGYSEDPDRRFTALQGGSDCKLEILVSVPGDFITEKQYHRLFAKDRLSGEWFTASDALKACVNRLIDKFPTAEIILPAFPRTVEEEVDWRYKSRSKGLKHFENRPPLVFRKRGRPRKTA